MGGLGIGICVTIAAEGTAGEWVGVEAMSKKTCLGKKHGAPARAVQSQFGAIRPSPTWGGERGRWLDLGQCMDGEGVRSLDRNDAGSVAVVRF